MGQDLINGRGISVECLTCFHCQCWDSTVYIYIYTECFQLFSALTLSPVNTWAPECSLSSHGAHMQSFWSTGSQPSSVCPGVGSCRMAAHHPISSMKSKSFQATIQSFLLVFHYLVFSIYKGEFHANDLIPSPVFRTFGPTIC